MPKLIDMVRNNAPMIGAMLGATGPIGAAAGVILNGVLGLGKDAPQKATEEAMAKATPEQILALQKAEQDFVLAMRQADVQEEAVHAGDRGSARSMYAATKDNTPQVLSYILIPAVLFYVLIATLYELPPAGVQLAREVLMYLFGVMSTVLTFWFGSSSGSRQKTDAMSNLIAPKK
jgi:hypothetical protein